MNQKVTLKKIYDLLEKRFGDLEWWPAETDFEVIVGAMLTQNTTWRNVEKAIKALRSKDLLLPDRIVKVDIRRLAGLIRPSGYYRVKAGRLKEISRFVMSECSGKLQKLKIVKTEDLRKKLLAIKGVGPETADSILIYALGKPVFVVDAYTKRVFLRHKLIHEDASYGEVQSLVHEHFPLKEKPLNQFHALLVEVAKQFCKKRAPLCSECPLGGMEHKV